MFCSKCGAENEDNAWKCKNCQATLDHLPTEGTPVKVPSYLAQAILCTFCCCVPFGIPAIVFAAQVNSKLAAGDIEGAEASSARAKKWCWIAFWLGLIGGILYLGLQFITAKMGISPSS